MKKVLTFEGKRRSYDTDTAKLLGEGGNGLSVRDFSHVREALYVTKVGAYFIHGEGGPMSKYSVQTDTNSWSGGSRITPITLDQAKEWAEKNMTGEEYIDAFGPPEETEGTCRLELAVSPGFYHRMEVMRSETGKSISQLVEEKFDE